MSSQRCWEKRTKDLKKTLRSCLTREFCQLKERSNHWMISWLRRNSISLWSASCVSFLEKSILQMPSMVICLSMRSLVTM